MLISQEQRRLNYLKFYSNALKKYEEFDQPIMLGDPIDLVTLAACEVMAEVRLYGLWLTPEQALSVARTAVQAVLDDLANKFNGQAAMLEKFEADSHMIDLPSL